jgi:hypothetical protein
MRWKTLFKEVFLFRVLHDLWFSRPRGQNKHKHKHKHKVTIHIQETHQTIAHTIKNRQGKQHAIAEIVRGTSSTNDA